MKPFPKPYWIEANTRYFHENEVYWIEANNRYLHVNGVSLKPVFDRSGG